MTAEVRRRDWETRIPAKAATSTLGISRRTLTNWAQRGLRTFRLGGLLYTSEAAVLDFMDYHSSQDLQAT